MPVGPFGEDELADLGRLIDGWARGGGDVAEAVTAVDHDQAERRWYLRLRGEEKAVITVWLTLRERTLHFETYFMPGPEERHQELWEYLLRLNQRLFVLRFALGAEDAVYLVGQLPVSAIDADELDRVVGAAYAYTEQWFAAAMSIGYASKFHR